LKKTVLSALLVVLPLVVCGTSIADVVDSNANGFTTVSETVIGAPRAEVWLSATKNVDQWWSSDHTVSGEASRLSIKAKPQGCFCEHLGKDAGVVHMTVTTVLPEVVLRLTGGLGPLGLMGVNGNMTWEFEEADADTRVKFTYAVGGYRPDGLDGIATAVDRVIGEALLRLKAHVEKGDAEQFDGE